MAWEAYCTGGILHWTLNPREAYCTGGLLHGCFLTGIFLLVGLLTEVQIPGGLFRGAIVVEPIRYLWNHNDQNQFVLGCTTSADQSVPTLKVTLINDWKRGVRGQFDLQKPLLYLSTKSACSSELEKRLLLKAFDTWLRVCDLVKIR
jgi:hypothetical protein